MRRNVYALLLAATLVMPAFAQDSRNTGIQKTITDQIDALRAEDFARAFSFASPTIKALFLTPENFGAMVQKGYPMVADPSAVKMLGLRDVAGGLWQRVMVTDREGRTFMLDYQMVEAPDGWQINAVHLLPEAGVGA